MGKITPNEAAQSRLALAMHRESLSEFFRCFACYCKNEYQDTIRNHAAEWHPYRWKNGYASWVKDYFNQGYGAIYDKMSGGEANDYGRLFQSEEAAWQAFFEVILV